MHGPAAMPLMISHGTIVRGHRVASGLGRDRRFPEGTIAAQLPFFRRLVPGFDAHLGGSAFPGTINVGFAGCVVAPARPEIRLVGIDWTAHFPPETFFLSRCALVAGDAVEVPVFLYMPDPVTKPGHFQPSGIVELLARFVPGLAYGTPVALRHDAAAVMIRPRP